MKNLVLIALVLLLTTGLVAAFAAPQGDVAKGKQVYAKNNCKVCHQIAKEGSPKSVLDGVGAKYNEDQMKKWIRTPKQMNPKSTMLAYPATKISDADLADLVAYMMSLK